MKKITLLLSIICALCTNMYAWTTVKSLAELRQLADGTEVIFEGEAMTTSHFSRYNSPINGIFIQDSTDAILLNHQYFNAKHTWFEDPNYNGYKMNQGGTVVTSFSGTFKKATTTMPDRVVFTEDDMEYVESSTTDNPIPYISLTIDELIANSAKYENMVVSVNSSVVKEGKGVYNTTYSFVSGENKMPIHLRAGVDGRSVPAGGRRRHSGLSAKTRSPDSGTFLQLRQP